jgi:Protein of unknown function (DUF2865)
VPPRRLTTAAVYALAGLSTLGLAGTCATHYGGGFGVAQAQPAKQDQAPTGANAPPMREVQPRVRLANSGGGGLFSFFEGLFGIGPPSAARRPRARDYRQMPPARSVPRPEPASPPAAGGDVAVGTYRTMCVRLCDGYYWPVSFATSMDRFGRDADACSRSCGASVALYYYANPGGAPEDMVSLDGRSYKNLGTAFLYRATYDASCKCRAHPWEEAAIERHKGYAKSGEVRAAQNGRRRGR